MKNIVCFHNPDENNGYLSNWYLSNFIVDDIQFSSMEQYMMYSKACLFNDTDIANKVLNTTDVREIKALGREVKGFNDSIWDKNKEDIVFNGCYNKFSQNNELREKLLNTKDAILAECAVKDKIWGIGLSMTDDRRFHTNKWRGQNLLGKCLMRVREKLC